MIVCSVQRINIVCKQHNIHRIFCKREFFVQLYIDRRQSIHSCLHCLIRTSRQQPKDNRSVFRPCTRFWHNAFHFIIITQKARFIYPFVNSVHSCYYQVSTKDTTCTEKIFHCTKARIHKIRELVWILRMFSLPRLLLNDIVFYITRPLFEVCVLQSNVSIRNSSLLQSVCCVFASVPSN